MTTNYMPLIHQARRVIRNRQEGNPFATDWALERELEALTHAYLRAPNHFVANLIKVEIDTIETLI